MAEINDQLSEINARLDQLDQEKKEHQRLLEELRSRNEPDVRTGALRVSDAYAAMARDAEREQLTADKSRLRSEKEGENNGE